MAWRDSRSSRWQLLFLSFSIVLGTGALVAFGSLSSNLRRALNDQANGMLGADLVITGTIPASDAWTKALTSIGGEAARERSFSTPLTFPSGAQRVLVRAIEGGFPFY